MKCCSIASIAVLFAASARCFGDVSQLIEYHWNTFSNIDRFQEFSSTTNLPAEIRTNIVEYQGHVFANLAEEWHYEKDGWAPMVGTFKLDWAATDGTNYVVHWEVVPPSLEQALYMAGGLPYVTAAIRENSGTNLIISTGPCSFPLADYNEFIQYEISQAREKLDEAVSW